MRSPTAFRNPKSSATHAAKSRIDGGRSPLAIAVTRAIARAALRTSDVMTNARMARYHIYCLLFGRRGGKCSQPGHFAPNGRLLERCEVDRNRSDLLPVQVDGHATL